MNYPEQLRQLSQRCCRLAENPVAPTIASDLAWVALQIAMLAQLICIECDRNARMQSLHGVRP